MKSMGHLHAQWQRAVGRTLDSMLARHDPFHVAADTGSLRDSLELHANDSRKTVTHKCGGTDAGAIRQMLAMLSDEEVTKLVSRVCAKRGDGFSGTHEDAVIGRCA